MKPSPYLPQSLSAAALAWVDGLRPAADESSDDPRDRALSSAVVLRDCSLRPYTSNATRRACRTVMREQAIKWRRPPGSAVTGPQIH